MASITSKNHERVFESSLQYSRDTIASQSAARESSSDAYLKEVAKIVVEVLNFKNQYPTYNLPKSFSLEMCAHKLKGYCKFDPCFHPHRYALRDAAIYLENLNNPFYKRVLCTSGKRCTFKKRCTFLHQEDITLKQYIKNIFQNRAKHSNKTSGSNRSRVAEVAAEHRLLAVTPSNNIFACLNTETESTSDSDESNADRTNSPLPIETSVEEDKLPEVVLSVVESIFDEKADELPDEPVSPKPYDAYFQKERELVAFQFDKPIDDADFKSLE